MGTSNWQNIPFCVEAILLIEPRKVLDVGVGFGRWGIVMREFGELWHGRIHRPQWKVRVEGVEAFPANIDEYHRYFYDRIHEGDARNVLPTLDRDWDLAVFGDVLEHFEREEGEEILQWALDSSAYVMVNIPLGENWEQDASYGNPFEIHRSVWTAADFETLPLRRSARFRDSIGRDFGAFLLSRADPCGLARRDFPSDLFPSLPWTRLRPDDQLLVSRVEALAAELAELKSSRGYRLLEVVRTSPLGKPLARIGKVVLPLGARVARFARRPFGEERVPSGTGRVESERASSVTGPSPVPDALVSPATAPRTGRPLAVCHPGWRGIRRSTQELFESIVEIPDGLAAATLDRKAREILDLEPSVVAFQGFPRGYGRLVRELRRLAPGLPLDVVWHGSFVHVGEDYAWEVFLELLELSESGAIRKVGFVKAGLAEIYARRGYRTGFVMNYVRAIPDGPSVPLAGGPHLGIWAIQPTGLKIPYVAIAAASLVPGAILHGSGAPPRARSLAGILGVQGDLRSDAVPMHDMPSHLAGMHVNVYVTFSECAPMLPLESLSVGVPCLLGPTAHYFEDEEYLHRRLVVPSPDRADVIGEHIRNALGERDRIVDAYRIWAPAYNERALRALEEFLEVPLATSSPG